jgi:ABC-type methionine transport system ATPase subunit
VVIVTHQMNIVNDICDKVAVMEGGRVLESYSLADADYEPTSEIGQLLSQRHTNVFKLVTQRERAYA